MVGRIVRCGEDEPENCGWPCCGRSGRPQLRDLHRAENSDVIRKEEGVLKKYQDHVLID